MASLSGSLLAPDATVTLRLGRGRGFARSSAISNGSGNGGAFHNKPFTGTLTSVVAAVTNVPEPGTLVILSSALVAFVLARRRIAMRQVTRPLRQQVLNRRRRRGRAACRSRLVTSGRLSRYAAMPPKDARAISPGNACCRASMRRLTSRGCERFADQGDVFAGIRPDIRLDIIRAPDPAITSIETAQ